MSKDVEPANNSKSIGSPSNPSYNAIPGPESTRPFANCSMDLITDLPPITLENGTIIDALMVVVDHGLTKGVVITPCAKDTHRRRRRRNSFKPSLQTIWPPRQHHFRSRPPIYRKSIPRTPQTPWNQIKIDDGVPPTIRRNNRTVQPRN
jgi:hypothetical protein